MDGKPSRHTGRPLGSDRKVDSRGYIQVRTNRPGSYRWGWELEHRVVMEDVVGRSLRPEEDVHHIDGNKTNNDPVNLVLFESRGAHLRHHYPKGAPVAKEDRKS